MKLALVVALISALASGFGRPARAQAIGAAPAQAVVAACTATAFAKGQCDTLDAASAPPAKPLLGAPAQPSAPSLNFALHDGAQPQAGEAFHIDSNGQQAFEKAASEFRSQNAAGPTPGGVPAMRPLGRPAVVVPLITF